MTLTQTIKYIFLLSMEKKGWLVVFFIGSLLTRFLISNKAINKCSNKLGHQLDNRVLTMLASKEQVVSAVEMGKFMSMVANNTPWKCQCLSQALCVKWLLNRYKIPSVFYFGSALEKKDNKTHMKAHAWIDVGSKTVIGGPQHQHYKVVATFTTPQV